MIKMKQHVPSWADIDKVFKDKIDKIEDIKELDFVKTAMSVEGFHQLSFDGEPGDPEFFLMQELNEGKNWWVVAYIYGTTFDEMAKHFPKWSWKT